MATQKEATLRLYTTLNSPAKAGRVWVQYERKTIDAALDVLKQMMLAQGYEFRPADTVQPMNASDSDVAAWAERHDINRTPTELRCMFDDAATLTPN